MSSPLILTRPAVDSEDWARELRDAGFTVLEWPLIEIRPARETAPVLIGKGSFEALMFVSRAAVRHFFSSVPTGDSTRATLLQAVRFWVTGPGSATELQRHGVAARQIDMPGDESEQFDSEALWQLVAEQVSAGFRLLIIRGRDVPDGRLGRPWLAERVRELGGKVSEWVVYERRKPKWGSEQTTRARQASADGSIWLFSSSLAIENLLHLMPGQDWSKARALATHSRVTQRARQAGFSVATLSRASIAGVIASIKSGDEFGQSISSR